MSDSITPGSGIQVGDAVVEFLANTQNFDQGVDKIEARSREMAVQLEGDTTSIGHSFDSLGDEASSAADDVEEAGRRSGSSLREARGEAMLLGEAFGVHLPRHVSSFIASLPGVGEAMSAAFSATAVLFVLEAVVKLTEKVSDFVSTTFIYTQAMRDADKATADLNKSILANEASIASLNEAYDQMTMSPLQLLTKALDDVNKQIADQEKSFASAKDTVFAFKQGMDGVTEAEAKAAEQTIALNASTMEKLTDQNRNLSAQIQKIYDDDAKKHADMLKKELADVDQYNEDVLLKTIQTQDEIADGVKQLHAGRGLPEQVFGPLDDFQKYEEAAKTLGITLKSNLVTALEAAKKAQADLIASGHALPAELHAAQVAVKSLQDQVNQFGKEIPNQLITPLGHLKSILSEDNQAVYNFGNAFGSAFEKVVSGSEKIGPAMAQATKAYLASQSQMAAIDGMVNLAKGFAALAGFEEQSASFYFQAAGIDFAVAGAAGAVAGAMPGGSSGGSGGSNGTSPTSSVQTSSTSSSQSPTVATVQHFASGGLISSPTLAMIGDSPSGGAAPEAVLPLHDPEAMAQIAGAISAHMGGGQSAGHTFNMWGNISNSDLKKLAKKINRQVHKGQLLMQASNSLRITKRSP